MSCLIWIYAVCKFNCVLILQVSSVTAVMNSVFFLFTIYLVHAYISVSWTSLMAKLVGCFGLLLFVFFFFFSFFVVLRPR